MGKVYNAKDLYEALELAKGFKNSGTYNLFRGQSSNWNVKSSAARLSTKKTKDGLEKLKRLYYYLQTHEPLTKYFSNTDWFYAVAQHYGLPTNYIDFTKNPEVAMFFATNAAKNKLGEESVIICLNENDFIDVIDFTKSFFEFNNILKPYITKPNVDNLWRLEAQEGCFLFSSILEIEQVYDFDRIVFPFSEPFNKIEKEFIYPEKKSELEILLDHYFNAESKIEGEKRFRKFAKEVNMNIVEFPTFDYSVFLKKKQFHSSWTSIEFEKWLYKIEEKLSDIKQREELCIDFSYKLDINKQILLIYNALEKSFKVKNIKRNCAIDFNLTLDSKISNKLAKQINHSCSRIWDGTRNLPFLDTEIIEIIAKYVCLELHKNKSDKIPSLSKEKLITLELTNEYGSITRSYASPSKVTSAFRSDISEIVIDKLAVNISSEILLYVNDPKIVFDFSKLLGVFKDELIAYQILHNSEKKNPVIFYTPTQITVLGYA